MKIFLQSKMVKRVLLPFLYFFTFFLVFFFVSPVSAHAFTVSNVYYWYSDGTLSFDYSDADLTDLSNISYFALNSGNDGSIKWQYNNPPAGSCSTTHCYFQKGSATTQLDPTFNGSESAFKIHFVYSSPISFVFSYPFYYSSINFANPVLLDKTSNGNDLTNHNGVLDTRSYLPNVVNDFHTASLAASSSQYLTTADNSAWKPSSNITLEGWFYFVSLPGSGNYPVLMSNISTTHGYGWDWFYDGDTGKIRFYVNTGSGSFNASSNTTVSSGAWHHYAVTYDGSIVRFYLDGVADGTSSQSLALGYESGQNPAIGAYYFGGWIRFLNAYIDEARIWDTARSATDVNNDMGVQLVGNESGLAAYYPFETFTTSNLSLTDKTSNGDDLTDHNSVSDLMTFLPSVANNSHAAGLAASSSQYLTATDSAAWKPSSNITLEAWVYFVSLPGSLNYPVLMSNISTTHGYGWDWFYDGDTGKIRFYVNTGSGSFNASSSTSPSTGAWHHYAVTYDGSIVRFYLDGVADGTSSQSLALGYESGQNPAIGAYYYGGWIRQINANIDEVRIWNTIRSVSDISSNKGVRLVGNESGLTAYYPFETL